MKLELMKRCDGGVTKEMQWGGGVTVEKDGVTVFGGKHVGEMLLKK